LFPPTSQPDSCWPRAHTSFTDWLADNDDAAGAANAEMVATAVLTTIETIE
jgi:hypothetical protein